MAKEPTCLVCKKVMERGFLTDLSHVGTFIHLPRWCPGKPQSNFLSGEAHTAQFNQGLKVVAYRCPECEALRLYAPSTE